METFLAKMRTASRTWAGFGLLLALLMVTAGISLKAFSDMRHNMAEYRDMARDTVLSGQVLANALMMRLAVKDFAASKSVESIDNFRERSASLLELLAEADTAIENPERAQILDDITADVNTYITTFDEIVASRDERLLAVGKLDEIGPEIRKKLTEIIDAVSGGGAVRQGYSATAAHAQEELLLGRLYASKFRQSAKPGDADRAESHLTKAAEHVAAMREQFDSGPFAASS